MVWLLAQSVLAQEIPRFAGKAAPFGMTPASVAWVSFVFWRTSLDFLRFLDDGHRTFLAFVGL
jgi:hypothetical protein